MKEKAPVSANPDERARRISDVVRVVAARRLGGDIVRDAEVLDSHPDLMPELKAQLASLGRVESGRRSAESDPQTTTEFDSPRDDRSFGPPDSMAPSIPGYQLLGEIHRGGQGVVYRAIQASTKRKVAIKVMKEGPFASRSDRARFDREVQILGALDHPNIVTIHDSGVAAGCLYFVMNYISGRPLDEYVRSLGTAKRRQPEIKEVLRLFAVICRAVNSAHLRGILHRDLKPGNIRVDAEGQPHVLDFGLARSAGETDASMMTVTGQFVGSLSWASPEQAEGIPSKIDVRTDVYSLGVILYYLLTGRFPYDVVGNMRDVLDNILRAEPVRPGGIRPEIDDEVGTILLTSIQKERERRYQNAGELARDIENYLAGRPIEAKRDSTIYLLRKQLRRYRVPLAVAAGFVLVLIASSIVAWTLYLRSQNNLWKAYIAQARARQTSGMLGQRTESLIAISKAAEIRTTPELRNLAIAAMAKPDIRAIESVDAPDGSKITFVDPLLRRVFFDLRDDATLRVYDLIEQGELWRAPRANWLIRHSLCFRSDIVSFPGKSGYEIRDSTSGKLIQMLDDPEFRGKSYAADLSTDASRAVFFFRNGKIRIVDLPTGKSRLLAIAPDDMHVGGYRRIRFDSKCDRVAVCSSLSNRVMIYDAASGEPLHDLMQENTVWGLVWSPDDELLAFGCGNDAILWDVKKEAARLVLKGHTNLPNRFEFSHDGTIVSTQSWDGSSRLWDVRSGRSLLEFPTQIVGFGRDDDRVLAYLPQPDGSQNLQLAEIAYQREFKTLDSSEKASQHLGVRLNVHSSGRVAVLFERDALRVWDLAVEIGVARPPLPSCFGLDPVTGDVLQLQGGRVYRWRAELRGNTLHIGPPRVLEEIDPAVCRADIVAGMNKLAAIQDSGDVTFIDLDHNGRPRRYSVHPMLTDAASTTQLDRNHTFKFDPRERWVAHSHDADVDVWSLATGQRVFHSQSHQEVQAIFSPDGRWLIERTSFGHAFRRTSDWQMALKLDHSSSGRHGGIAFSPNGTTAAISELDLEIALVDLTRPELIARLRPPVKQARTKQVAFDRTGSRLLFSGNYDHLLYEWDLSLIRAELSRMGLDWDLPLCPPTTQGRATQPLRVEVDYGEQRPTTTQPAT